MTSVSYRPYAARDCTRMLEICSARTHNSVIAAQFLLQIKIVIFQHVNMQESDRPKKRREEGSDEELNPAPPMWGVQKPNRNTMLSALMAPPPPAAMPRHRSLADSRADSRSLADSRAAPPGYHHRGPMGPAVAAAGGSSQSGGLPASGMGGRLAKALSKQVCRLGWFV